MGARPRNRVRTSRGSALRRVYGPPLGAAVVKYLDRLRDNEKKVFGGDTAPTKLTERTQAPRETLTRPTKPGFVSFAGAAPSAKPPLNCEAIGVGVVEYPPPSAVQEATRRDVLARLEAHPTVKRAFTTRFEGAVLVVTLALRGVGTCELSIPADRFSRDSLADFDSLLRCLERQE